MSAGEIFSYWAVRAITAPRTSVWFTSSTSDAVSFVTVFSKSALSPDDGSYFPGLREHR